MTQPETIKVILHKLRRVRMDFRTAVFLMCILVSASFITQSKAVMGPSIKPGKRYSKFSPEADEGNFNQVQCFMFVTLRNMSFIQASSLLSNAVDVVTLSFCLFCFFYFTELIWRRTDYSRFMRGCEGRLWRRKKKVMKTPHNKFRASLRQVIIIKTICKVSENIVDHGL